MANRHFSQFREKKVNDMAPPKEKRGIPPPMFSTESTEAWPMGPGNSKNMNKPGFPKVKQSAKTNL
jgi:hypothetical protein